MEEKERFELFGEHCIKDNDPDARHQLLDTYVACVILNEQDKHIKELELLLKADKKIKTNSLNGFEKLRQENQQLKKTQKQLAIDELEKIKKFLIEKIAEKQACFDSGCYNDFADGVKTICEILLWEINKQIKKLKGEKDG